MYIIHQDYIYQINMKYWIISNNKNLVNYFLESGVNRIFIDLEKLGKNKRQKGKNLWLSDHKKTDIKLLRKIVPEGQLLVRLNPWNQNSFEEIDYAIENGADFLMLPMIRNLDEIKKFCDYTNFRAKVVPLIETSESIKFLEKITEIRNIEEIYIGLNDLKLSMGYKFLFEPLINGLLDDSAEILNEKNLSWGFGGIARTHEGIIPPELILNEHIRLNSKNVILSRSFHNCAKDLKTLNLKFNFAEELKQISDLYFKNKKNSIIEQQGKHNVLKTLIKKQIEIN